MHTGPHTSPKPPAGSVTFVQAFWFWLKLGFISFGGPAGQIALMHQELVEKRRWISERRFLHALNYCMLLPGPEAQQLATYIGWLMHKRWGGVMAGVLFVLPSLLILIALSWLYVAFHASPWVEGVLSGIKPAVVAIVAHAAYRMGSRVLHNAALWGIAVAAFGASFGLGWPFPIIMVLAAGVGILGGWAKPHLFQTSQPQVSNKAHHPPALIDDDTPAAQHTQWHRQRLLGTCLTGGLLWLIPIGTLCAVWGWQHTYTQMAWFFTKAALLTFGGAYAVLPYVYQGAVIDFAWVNPTQMMDGLALGETTPGPLIMVVAFVAFIGGYANNLLGAEHAIASGVLAACLVTWFTFLPSFVFILAGGPWVESTHRRPSWTSPLSAITAAVVGVVLQLALFFAYHVLWPQGFNHPIAWPALGMSLVAAWALFRWQRSVPEVLLACAAVGLVSSLPT